MKYMTFGIISFPAILFCLLTVAGCSGTKQLSSAEEKPACQQLGVFRSFQSSPNCQFLLVLETGKKLQVVGTLPDGIRMSDGMEVKVDYELVEELASACKAADAVVRITCLDLLKFPEEECANKSTAFNRSWMKDAIQFFNPTQIRYHETDSVNYFRLSGDQLIIFDCFGEVRCFGEEHPQNSDCRSLLEEMKNKEVIWAINY